MLEKGVVNMASETDAKSVNELLMILNSAAAAAEQEGDGFGIIPLVEAMDLQGLLEKLNGTGTGTGTGDASASKTIQVDE